MNNNLNKFLSNLFSQKNEKDIYVTFFLQSNIIQGNLVNISPDYSIVEIKNIVQNGKYSESIMEFASENFVGWGAKITEKKQV